MPPDLYIHLLGNFRIDAASAPRRPLPQARVQSLLAYLLLHRHAPQPRQHLAFLFWPDSSETQAYNNLRKALHALRSALPQPERLLWADAKTVQWRPDAPCVLDVALFEQHLAQADQDHTPAKLEQAVDLYTGDLLPGCYDDWITPERERLRERFLTALARLSEAFETQRDYAAAIRQANRLLRTDPLHEESYRRLLRLHLLNGDRAAALRTYHTCATALQRELGVEPSPLTQAAYHRLLGAAPEPAPPAMPSESPRPAQRQAGLVGRQAEWQRLLRVWQQACGGQAHFVWIAGEPGIGKTRLVEELAHWAQQQGFATAYARAYAAEGRLAYDPIAEWLRTEVLARRLATLEDAWQVEVARLLPELLAQHPDLPAPQPLTESWQRRRFFAALAHIFLAVAEPLLLVLDDLQWCDRETLEWLHYLLRVDPHSRLLIVGAGRPGELGDDHPLPALLREWRQTEQLTELELTPLTAPEVLLLAEQVAGHPRAAAQMATLYRVTEGNPLFVQEMVRATPGDESAPLPVKVRSVVEARLAQLTPAARQLAALAATSGRSFTFALLQQASALPEDTLVTALDELWQRRIVRAHGSDAYDFSHDIIREVAYTASTPLRRRLLHRQVAQALETIHAAELGVVSARIAAHYRLAGEGARAVTYYYRATYQMQFGYAYDEIITHLQQALSILRDQPRTAENMALAIVLHLALGRVLCTRASWADLGAQAAFETARQLCLASNNLEQLVFAQELLNITYSNLGNFQDALVLCESNLNIAEKLNKNKALETAHGGLGLLLCYMGDFRAAQAHLEQSARAARQADAQANPRHSFSYEGAFHHVLVLWLLGYPDTARQELLHIFAAQSPALSPYEAVVGCEFCVMLYHWRRELREMQVYAQKMLTEAEKYEFSLYRLVGQIYTIAATAALGEPNAGAVVLRQSIEALKAQGILMSIPYNLCLLAEIHIANEQYLAGMAAVDEALALATKTGEHLWLAETHRLRGELLVAQGAVAEAEAAYQQALAVARQQAAKSLELRAALGLSRLWQGQDKPQPAYDLLAPIYAWFSEGFATADLQAAQALLAVLAGEAWAT